MDSVSFPEDYILWAERQKTNVHVNISFNNRCGNSYGKKKKKYGRATGERQPVSRARVTD